MKIVNTSKLNPDQLHHTERDWVYNGLDCCVTAEVLDCLLPMLSPVTSATYDFSRALQGPVLDMRIRGILVDNVRKEEVVEHLEEVEHRLETYLERIVRQGDGFIGFNWRSTKDLQRLFYEIYRIPPIYTKEGRVTVNRAALEKMEAYTISRPVIHLMKALRDYKKKIEVLQTEIDDDGRMRTSYNIAGTNSGRFSSSISEFGTGGNLQNIEEGLRSIFIADPGKKLANFDAEQGESRIVGAIEWNLFNDSKYLDTCESGDLHTAVSKLCWPDNKWTGNPIKDRELAELPYYRHHSLRKLCKSIGHGTNYGGKPVTLNALYKIPIPDIAEFQDRYFKAFPAHTLWHEWVEDQLRLTGKLISFMGRQRYFFGRRNSPDVIREALAYDPQGSLADILNTDMLKVWNWSIEKTKGKDIQLLAQTHDSILVQYPQEKENEIISKIQTLMHHRIPLKHDRTLTIPYGCKTGWNWGDFSESNPDGLKKYTDDKRSRHTEVPKLDRKVHSTHR